MEKNLSGLTLFGVSVFIVALIAQPATSAELFTQCFQDADCDTEEHCSNNMCEVCVPCQSWLHREPPPQNRGRRCARSEDECGNCLPGYQSEELTNQRRTYKCYPAERLEAVQESETITWGTVFMGIGFFVIASAVVLATFFLRRGSPPRKQSLEKNSESEGLVVPSAPCLPPPPYNPSEMDETDNSYRVQPVRHDIFEPFFVHAMHTRATPIGPYHHHYEPVQPDHGPMELVEEVDFNPVLEFNHEGMNDSIPAENAGSTETIPSQWEPESIVSVFESPSPAQLAPPLLYRARSQSFEHLPFFARPENAPVDVPSIFARGQRSHSDPEIMHSRGRRASFAGETYAHRHVRLESIRSQNNQGSTAQGTVTIPQIGEAHEARSSTSMPDLCDSCEANSPSPFPYSEDEVQTESVQLPFSIHLLAASMLNRANVMHEGPSSLPNESSAGGSLDSGFFDASRRRHALNEETVEFGFAFYAKRSRQD